MIKKRVFKDSNYIGIWSNGKTIRLMIDGSKPITELEYPEFYDIKITGKCLGKCPWCYQNSEEKDPHYKNIVEKVINYFGPMSLNERPFQVAIGGGEPTEHPQFIELVKTFKEDLDICPNYTTNGMWTRLDNYDQYRLISATQAYCGGVAVSCHPHLTEYWEKAANLYWQNEIKLNFHIIISDKKSIDSFIDIYNIWKDKVDYFVLLPHSEQGRAIKKEIDWEYLVEKIDKDSKQIAFGANFYPYLLGGDLRMMNISMYEPEILSKYITLEGTGKMYGSSFSNEVIKDNLFNE